MPRYSVYLVPQAIEDLDELKANVRSAVKAAIEEHLGAAPTRTSRSRIKRLRALSTPQYRLRVGDVRVYYDVLDDVREVEVLAIIPKERSREWLAKAGETNETDTPD